MKRWLLLFALFAAAGACRKNQFTCKQDGWCIPPEFVCDGDADCLDGSDEESCSGAEDLGVLACEADQFMCKSQAGSPQRCISRSFLCDGESDCYDSSDEKNCTVLQDKCEGFHCHDGSRCVPTLNVCDGFADCGDASDEVMCADRRKPSICQVDEFDCGKHCIPWQKTCDGVKDCLNGDDEKTASCALFKCTEQCEHFCKHLRSKSECGCKLGFRLVDGKRCVIEDRCLAEGCAQSCGQMTNGNISCSCINGYKLNADGKRCDLVDNSRPLLVFATGSQIRSLDISNKQYKIEMRDDIMPHEDRILDFDLDIHRGFIYSVVGRWENQQYKSIIYRADIGNPLKKLIKEDELNKALFLTVDWLTGNLYIGDHEQRVIRACRPEGDNCVVIIDKTLPYSDIILDPSRGKMYWIESTPGTSGIYQASMDGSDRKVLIQEDSIVSIALDAPAERLFFFSYAQGDIECLSLKSGLRSSLKRLSLHNRPQSLTVFGDNIYWMESHVGGSDFLSCNKLTGDDLKVIVSKSSRNEITRARALHPVMQPMSVDDPCWHSPCSHICVVSGPSKYACKCPPSYSLTSKTDCDIDTDFLMLAADKLWSIPTSHGVLNLGSGIPLSANIQLFAFDAASLTIYAVKDDIHDRIWKISPKGDYRPTFVSDLKFNFISKLDFDPVNRLLIITDVMDGSVFAYSAARNETSKIIRLQPRSFIRHSAIDYLRGKIILVIQNLEEGGSIEQYSMSGKLLAKARLVDSTHVSRLTIDVQRGKIYFYDSKEHRILTFNDDFKTTEVVVGKVAGDLSSIIFASNRLVWTTSTSRGYYSASPVNGFGVEYMSHRAWMGQSRDLKFVKKDDSETKQLVKRCTSKNGGCSHTCVATLNSTICLCPRELTLDASGKMCVRRSTKTCSTGEFPCKNGYQCIPFAEKCDHSPQCDDGSDETQEACSMCDHGFLKCTNSAGCYSEAAKCDGIEDCSDGSDEKDCKRTTALPSCSAEQYRCDHTNKCIPKRFVCDGMHDCNFGDDEKDCALAECKGDRFKCHSGKCIKKDDVCDGWVDCEAGEDELICDTCPQDMFQCADKSLCVAKKFLCDDVSQCADSSDEADCKNSTRSGLVPEFCPKGSAIFCDGFCVHENEICDNFLDCEDGRDEKDCPKECLPTHFKCKSGACLPGGLHCDGEYDCDDKSDEEGCEAVYQKENSLDACAADQYRCANRDCISMTKVCDHKKDCTDGSDEGSHCSRNECASNPCQQHCHDYPEGFRCSCSNGYKLSADHITCEDIDECHEWDTCSHYCLNTKGSYECYCGSGFKLLSDNRTCAIEGKTDPVLLYISHNQIRAMSRRHHSMHAIASAETGVLTGLTFDAKHETVYWTEEDKLNMIPIGDHVVRAKTVRIASHMWQPSHIAYDWIADLMYYVDGKQQIQACNMNFTHCSHLRTVPLKKIRSLALVPTEGFMFYSYFAGDSATNNSTGGIIRSNMDGTDIWEIAKDMTTKPHYLQVDFIHGRLFYADLSVQEISHVDFFGKDHRVLVKKKHVLSFALLPDNIFWSEGQNLVMSDWFHAKTIKTILHDARATEMVVMHRVRQPLGKNACKASMCDQLCLLRPEGYSCACDETYSLALDNRTCYKKSTETAREGLHANLCDPPCQNGAFCVARSEHGYCHCPEGFSGTACENGIKSSSFFSLFLFSLLFMTILGTAIIGFMYLRGSVTIPPISFSTAAYRANEMKHLIDEKDDDSCGNSGDSGKNGSIVNPLYSVTLEEDFDNGQQKEHEQEQAEEQQPTEAPQPKKIETVIEGNLLDF